MPRRARNGNGGGRLLHKRVSLQQQFLSPWNWTDHQRSSITQVKRTITSLRDIDNKVMDLIRKKSEKLRRGERTGEPADYGPNGGVLFPFMDIESRFNEWFSSETGRRLMELDPVLARMDKRPCMWAIIDTYAKVDPSRPEWLHLHKYSQALAEHYDELILEHMFELDTVQRDNMARSRDPNRRQMASASPQTLSAAAAATAEFVVVEPVEDEEEDDEPRLILPWSRKVLRIWRSLNMTKQERALLRDLLQSDLEDEDEDDE